jgi:cold-inducible RNA-binding protein
MQGVYNNLPLRKKENKMNKNLYVANLSSNVTEEVLRDNFSEAGPITAVTLIRDKYTKQSRGFGFVEMETEEGASKAIEMMNGGTLDGKVIVVNEAKPKREDGGQRRESGRAGGFRSGNGGRDRRY